MALRLPELLAPAGSLLHLKMALSYGADAVYAGVPRWSLRVRGNGFSKEDFAEGISFAHNLGKKFYAVLNVIPHERRLSAFVDDLNAVAALKPDAFIMGDPGLIHEVRTRFPDIPVHLSVQANTVNSGTVKFWQSLGLTRCILARELSLGEITLIRKACPDMELEIFAHGALCIAVSGRCLISGLLSRRDANLGACVNSCRWAFAHKEIKCLTTEVMDRENYPGEWMPLEEDEHGSYLLNSKDLCTLPILEKMVATGVDSLKIEGRSRSPFYSGIVSRAYRLGLDAIGIGEPVPKEAFDIVNSIPARAYTTALLEPGSPDLTQDYEHGAPSKGRWEIVGQVKKIENGFGFIDVKNHFERTDNLVLYTPQGPLEADAGSLETENGEPLEAALGSGWKVRLKLDYEGDLSLTTLVRTGKKAV